ncbi:group I intron-associated PD-(D/E)XK endonuclease [Leucobacter sp. HY1910]
MYRRNMTGRRSYTDAALTAAIAESDSWRGVLRTLGLTSRSAGTMRSVRSHAERLALDFEHFRGQRKWKEAQLREAVQTEASWCQVVAALGVGIEDVATLKGHALRLGLDTGHLTSHMEAPSAAGLPNLSRLDRAGPLVAAAWYTLAGYDVSWPLEPCRYDLLVVSGATVRRVQVKTTTVRAGRTWKVYLSSSSGQGRRRTYDPDQIDEFFIVDGDLRCYLIPVGEVGGLHAIHLVQYRKFECEEWLSR